MQQLTPSLEAREPIAIIGIGCRLPGGVNGPESFWSFLANGGDGVTEVPADRWPVDRWYSQNPREPGRMITRRGGFLSDVWGFDPSYFGISGREAEKLDPQQRLALEVCWESLDHAGIDPAALRGSRTGVFMGVMSQDAALLHHADPEQLDGHAYAGAGFVANRISHAMDLRGPSLSVDTACSSALTAVYLACQSLRSGETDVGLAGGINLMLHPGPGVLYSKWGMLSPDGVCATFDAAANGFVRGEGCGMVVLKRLRDCVPEERCLAVIHGFASNQDGQTSLLTAPNGLAQSELYRRALLCAGLEPGQVGYLECHGTGTALGDPIEVEGICRVYGQQRPLILGAVKTNIGHLEGASGIAGLIKLCLCLQAGEIPPNLHFQRLNPHLVPHADRIRLPDRRMPWPNDGGARFGAVSAFGAGGSNVHLILGEAPALAPESASDPEPAPTLFVLSAHSPVALSAFARCVADWLANKPCQLADLGYSSWRRRHEACRAAFVVSSRDELRGQLYAFAEGAVAQSPSLYSDPRGEILTRMGQAYVAGQAVRWQALYAGIGRRFVALPPYPWQRKLYRLRDARQDRSPESAALPEQDRLVHPVLHIVHRGARTLFAGALDPSHSPLLAEHRVGGVPVLPFAAVVEMVAACFYHVAGVLPCLRDVTMHEAVACEAGETVAIQLYLMQQHQVPTAFELYARHAAEGPWSLVAEGRLAVAATAAEPVAQSTRSGLPLDPQAFYRHLERAGLSYGRGYRRIAALRVGTNTADAEIRAGADDVSPTAPVAVPLLDAAMHGVLAAIWGAEQGADLYLPVGAEEIFLGHGAPDQVVSHIAVSGMLSRAEERQADIWITVPGVPGQGVWAAVKGLRLRSRTRTSAAASPSSLLYRPVWRPLEPAPPYEPGAVRERLWVVFTAPGSPCEPLVRQLRDLGAQVIAVTAGTGLQRLTDDPFVIDPTDPNGYQELLRLLADAQPVKEWHLIYGWATPEQAMPDVQGPTMGLLHLLQAVLRLGYEQRCRVHAISTGSATAAHGVAGLASQAVRGVARVAALEHQALWGGLVEVDHPHADTLLRELLHIRSTREAVVKLHERTVQGVRLVRESEQPSARLPVRSDGSYLITGGLGALGLATAEWLAHHGAGALVLVGRSGGSPALLERVRRLEQAGTRVRVLRADVADRGQLKSVLDGLRAPFSELRGVFHAAGVLKDAVLERQSQEGVAAVFGPKATGAWALHELTLRSDLDFFVLYSSIASLFGSRGQGNYAAANAFLDALAHFRQSLGLPGLSVNWGAWDGGGMIARADATVREVWEGRGVRGMQPRDALRALEQALVGGAAQVCVAEIQWQRYLTQFDGDRIPGLFAEVAPAAFSSALLPARPGPGPTPTPGGQREALVAQLVDEVIAIMRLPLSRAAFQPDRSLFEYGMDSLMVLEYRDAIQRMLGRPIASSVIFEQATVERLANYLLAGKGRGA